MKTFIKSNSSIFEDSFVCEAEGLGLLRKWISKTSECHIKIPKIIKLNKQRLELEMIASKRANTEQWYQFGQSLARLHKIRFQSYGLQQDNYIGLNPQKNTISDNWGKFFFEYRLMFQVDLIQDQKIQQEFSKILLIKKNDLIRFLNDTCEQASLVHGDLWSGNLLFDHENAWLIDPAVYYADREVDIAMTEMFGGFSAEFYQGYDSIYPRSREYIKKKQIYNLYHYLNHYNLFGGSYYAQSYNLLKSI